MNKARERMTQRLIIEERRRSQMEYRESQLNNKRRSTGGRGSNSSSGLPVRRSTQNIDQIKKKWAEIDGDDHGEEEEAADPLSAVSRDVLGPAAPNRPKRKSGTGAAAAWRTRRA